MGEFSIQEPRGAGVREDGAGLGQGLGEGERRWNQEIFRQVDKQNLRSVTDTVGTEKRTSPSLFFHPLQSPARSPNRASFQFFSDILVGWLFCHSVSDLALSPPETGQQLLGLTLMPSIRKPRVDVELTVSLHCM